MIPNIDKKNWQEVKGFFKTLNPLLFEILEEINPVDHLFYILKYPYGQKISDDKFFYIPDSVGNIVSKDVKHFPYFFLVKNNLELYLETHNNIISEVVYQPGDFFPFTVDLPKNRFVSKPISPFSLNSGIRSLIILPLTNEGIPYFRLLKKYGLSSDLTPSNPNTHFEIFKSIANQEDIKWASELVMFDNKWEDRIQNDMRYYKLRLYILEKAIRTNDFRTNTFYLDYALNEIVHKQKIPVKNYTLQVLKNLFSVAVCDSTGYRPVSDETGMPINMLLEKFNEIYQPNTTPCVVECSMRNDSKNLPIYASIAPDNKTLTNKKSFQQAAYLNEIADYKEFFLDELSRNRLTCESAYGSMKNILELTLYSERGNNDRNIHKAIDLLDHDKRFKVIYDKYKDKVKYGFSVRSSFTKSLIGITLKR
ncbi:MULTISPECIES: hypothetical protein [Cysteiniphilum]|uniref:Uncharacterized protein n=1 Tax=Cysteiniphilum litorale TaxID=2056700 RepID=A0A8J2Z4T8_9GAMM|nr:MULTISPECIES: hypothetical protein [Cysteiniphilum]GGF99071.1 hypothetical protein GCM10010995_15440 [Cysteiniphilum litorale]